MIVEDSFSTKPDQKMIENDLLIVTHFYFTVIHPFNILIRIHEYSFEQNVLFMSLFDFFLLFFFCQIVERMSSKTRARLNKDNE